ncbi:MAG: hypothetical protein ABSH21_02095 [Verrucomicrobiia bacterium]|jgi:HD superfamily phosphohydrolase
MKLTKRIRTVLYDDQKFSALELELLHTPSFQRLYDLHQLGLTDRVFIDASHSRLHHVVGVVEQATNLMESLVRNLLSKPESPLEYTGGPHNPSSTSGDFARLVKRRIPAARLMALLHDLTHTPYGHTLEDEIRLVEEKHDEPHRQADAYYRVALQLIGWLERNSMRLEDASGSTPSSSAPKLAALLEQYLDAPDLIDPPTDAVFIDYVSSLAARLVCSAHERRGKQPFAKHGTKDLTQFLKDLSFAMRAMLYLEAAHKEEVQPKHIPNLSYPVDRLFDSIFEKLRVSRRDDERFAPHRDAFMLDVIGNTICADLLDYAKRDSVTSGLKLNYDPNRIIENFTLISHSPDRTKVVQPDDADVEHPFAQHSIRTAISLFGHKLRTDVPGELLNLLQVRYYVYERMLYHPTKCIAGAMMGAAVQLIGWKTVPSHFQLIGDSVFLRESRDAARLVRSLLDSVAEGTRWYSPEIRDDLKGRLNGHPDNGVTKAANKLLEDRIVQLRDLKKKLDRLCSLKPHKNASLQLRNALTGARLQNDAALDTGTRGQILAGIPEGDAKTEAKTLLDSLMPDVERMKQEIEAGLSLLGRLAARQFYKGVFRLLQNVTDTSGKKIKAAEIAEKFLDSTTRFIAEREIEIRAKLPVGSLVIHCPSAEGPKKIANILITGGVAGQSNGEPQTVPLYDVGKLHSPVFEEHQKAIKALQDMYGSMWRLVVSVAPAQTHHWKTIVAEAGNVIYEVLTGGDDTGGPAKNDHYMEMEIESSLRPDKGAATDGHVRVEMPDGDETSMPTTLFRFLEGVARILDPDEFKSVLNADGETPDEQEEIDASLAKLKSLIQSGKSAGETAGQRHRKRVSKQKPTTRPRLRKPAHLPEFAFDAPSAASRDVGFVKRLNVELDAVLSPYQSYLPEGERDTLNRFRSGFVDRAKANPALYQRILDSLQTYKVTMLTQEQIAKNQHGKAQTIMKELEKLLS